MKEVYNRRSIRKYKNKPVPRSLIEELIKAGMNAPSGHNQQPWQFLVIDQREKLEQIMAIHPYSIMLKEAPTAIMVCGDMAKLKKDDAFWSQDCSAATQNILLEIEHKGLGGVWIGVYPKENYVKALRELFHIPEELIPFSLIAVGYKNVQKEPNDRFDKSLIHYNEWM